MDISFEFLREVGVANGILRMTIGTCAVDGCAADAEMELRHGSPDSDAITWVPVCREHEVARYRGEPLEYVVQLHGFMPRCQPIVNGTD